MIRHSKRLIRRISQLAGYDIVPAAIGSGARSWVADARQLLGADVKTIFDVGANIGQAASTLSTAFANAKVFSFEPGTEAFRTLVSRFADHPSVLPQNVALGAKSDAKELFCHKASVVNSLLPSLGLLEEKCRNGGSLEVGTETVDVIRLEDFCADRAVDVIDLLKIDTQGYEMEVLNGCGAMLAPEAIHAIVLEANFCAMYESQASVPKLFELLLQAGYGFVGMYNVRRNARYQVDWCDLLFAA